MKTKGLMRATIAISTVLSTVLARSQAGVCRACTGLIVQAGDTNLFIDSASKDLPADSLSMFARAGLQVAREAWEGSQKLEGAVIDKAEFPYVWVMDGKQGGMRLRGGAMQ